MSSFPTYNEERCSMCDKVIGYIQWSLDTEGGGNYVCPSCYAEKISEDNKISRLKIPKS